MLSVISDGNLKHCPFEQLQKRLLCAFMPRIRRRRKVFALAAGLVDLIDIDDTALRRLNISAGSLDEITNDGLDITADITGRRIKRCVRNDKRNAELFRQMADDRCLAASGWSNNNGIRLL